MLNRVAKKERTEQQRFNDRMRQRVCRARKRLAAALEEEAAAEAVVQAIWHPAGPASEDKCGLIGTVGACESPELVDASAEASYASTSSEHSQCMGVSPLPFIGAFLYDIDMLETLHAASILLDLARGQESA